MNKKVEGTLVFDDGTIVPLESLEWTKPDRQRFGLDDDPATPEALQQALGQKNPEQLGEARVCPMILLRIPRNAPANREAEMSITWEIEFIGKVSGATGVKKETFDKTFHVRIYDEKAHFKQAVFFWGTLGLLLATCTAALTSGRIYPKAAAL